MKSITAYHIAPYLAVALLSVGCATKNVSFADAPTPAGPVLTVRAKSIGIEDLTVPRPPESPSGWIYRSGWMPIDEAFTSPRFAELVVADLKASVKGDGSVADSVHITIIEVGLFVDKSVADDVAFVNLVALGRERPYLCRATFSLRKGDQSVRIVAESQVVRQRHISDMDTADAKALIVECKAKLLETARAKIESFAKVG